MEAVRLNEDDIKKMIHKLKFIKKDKNFVEFEVGPQKFTITIPENSGECYFVDITSMVSGYEWLNRINEYILDKDPTFDKLLKYIEQRYEKENRKQKERSELFDTPDIMIDAFDLKEQQYKRVLEKNLDTFKSTLTLQTSDKTPILFLGKTPGLIIMNEFFELRKRYSKNRKIELDVVNNNIYHWNLKFRAFANEKLIKDIEQLNTNYKYDYIELDVHFHDKLYPAYPPFIRVVRPRLNNSLMHRITNMKMLQVDYWSPTRGMVFIVNKLVGIVDKHCSIDCISEMNDLQKYPHGAYHSMESILIKLASLCDVKNEYEPLDDENYVKVINVPTKTSNNNTSERSKQTSAFKRGTGYGTTGSSNWDPEEYVKIQREKDNQIKAVINTIIDNMQNYRPEDLIAIYKIISSSYVVPFLKSFIRGANLLEIYNHLEMYKLIFTFMQLLSTDDAIFLFDTYDDTSSLFDLLTVLFKEAQQAIRLNKVSGTDKEHDEITTMICTLYEMIKPTFDKYVETKNKNMAEKNALWNKKVEQNKSNVSEHHTKYIQTMNDMKFDVVKFNSNFKYDKHGSDLHLQPSTNKQVIQRLKLEYASMKNDLPICFESSIFVCVNEKDIRCMKVLITGPDNTPYDSGCFIFDAFTGTDYPGANPKILFRNHGGKRFNPNLYDNGYVCLSLLGTWQGSGGEKWNAKTSTLQQLFISVQSQILVDHPFFNEPGHETSYNSSSGMEHSRQYNNERRWYTLCHAMYDLIHNPDSYPEFSDVIKNHFILKKDYIKKLCDKWCNEPNNAYKPQTQEMANKVKAELEKFSLNFSSKNAC
jgi:baculoviral IAP repeat-containing protein 6